MSTVASILSKKGPCFNNLESKTPVIDALAIMNTQNLGYMVVTNDGEFAGLFSERDYAKKVALMGKSSKDTEVGEVANKDVPRLEMKDSLEKSMFMMNCYKTTYLPVFDDFEFKGVVTLNDVVKEVLENSDYDVVKDREEIYA